MLAAYVGYVSGSTGYELDERIKVVIPSDKGKSMDEIPYAYPLMPKMIHIIPKNEEAVIVLVGNDDEPNAQRYYIGPVLSHPSKFNFLKYVSSPQ